MNLGETFPDNPSCVPMRSSLFTECVPALEPRAVLGLASPAPDSRDKQGAQNVIPEWMRLRIPAIKEKISYNNVKAWS